MQHYWQALESFDVGILGWSLAACCAVLWGASKAGIKGIATIAVPIMAYVFGSRPSTGIVLPMLIIADMMAVTYYNRHAQWNVLIKILPWTMVGVVLGVWVGDSMDEEAFKNVMAILIVLSIGIMFWWERRKSIVVPDYWWFAASMGIAAGFTTMIGNLAGAIVTIYLLAMQLPKAQFIGTGAWFFMIINVFKVPMHVVFWGTITWQTLSINILMIPIIAIGFYLVGVKIVGKLHDDLYRKFVLIMTALAALVLLLR